MKILHIKLPNKRARIVISIKCMHKCSNEVERITDYQNVLITLEMYKETDAKNK